MKLKLVVLLSVIVASNAHTATKSTLNMPLIHDNMRFWSYQMMEHGQMASDFTHDPMLRKRGLELADRLKKFDKGNLTEQDRKEFLELSDLIKAYQNEVIAHLEKSKAKKDPKRDLYIALLKHMNLETDYAKKKAEGKQFSEREEVQFWSEEHEGEAHAIAEFMNPKASKLKREAQSLEKKLKSNAHVWADSLVVVEKANEELNEIGAELDQDPSKTSLPKKLAKHEERERKRAVETFELLKLQK